MASWWIGGYGADMDGTGTGIGLAHENDDGSLRYAGVVAEVASPSFLLSHGNRLFAAAEGAGRVEAFRLPDLAPEGGASSGGTWPCQLAVVGDRLVVANYFTGTLGVLPLRPDGSLGELLESVPGEGSGPHPEQDGSHMHASFALDDATLLSLDLGADRIRVHDVRSGRLEGTASVAVLPGTGPRDIARHPGGPIFVLGEFGGRLLVFAWEQGMLVPVGSTPLPGFTTGDQAAGLAFHGPFVYAALRGSNRIAVLRAGDDGRQLEPVGWMSSEGEWPRHLATGAGVLHVANQESATIASFRLGDDGLPALIAAPTPVPTPTYLLAAG